MPSAPKCKVCGASHWGGEPHKFATPLPPIADTYQRHVVAAAASAEETHSALEELAALKANLAAKKAKAAAYMRGYRARKKP